MIDRAITHALPWAEVTNHTSGRLLASRLVEATSEMYIQHDNTTNTKA